MTEEKKATTRHFFWALGAAFAIGCVSSVLRYVLPIPLVGDLVSIALFCVLAYVVLVHYTSVFIYEINADTLLLTRRIGAREKRIEIKRGVVAFVGTKKPQGKTENMCVSLLPRKKVVYITYRQDAQTCTVRIEPSGAFADELARVFGKEDI